MESQLLGQMKIANSVLKNNIFFFKIKIVGNSSTLNSKRLARKYSVACIDSDDWTEFGVVVWKDKDMNGCETYQQVSNWKHHVIENTAALPDSGRQRSNTVLNVGYKSITNLTI